MNPTYQIDELTSKTISLLRFPLCVAVVFIHTHMVGVDGLDNMMNPEYPFYSNFSYLISQIIAATAVPIFFLFSGYLFFNVGKSFTCTTYADKLKKRAKTILVPYLIWNFITLVFYATVLKVKPDLFNGPRLLLDFDLPNFLQAFWAAGEIGQPICGPLWFIRDLMVVMVCSPLIYLSVKYLKQVSLLLFTALYLSAIWKDLPGLSSYSFFYFFLGAYLSLHHHPLRISSKWITAGTTLVYLITLVYLMVVKEDKNPTLFNLNILSGVVCMLQLTATILQHTHAHISSRLTSGTFFIFASHYFPIIALCKVCMKVIVPDSSWSLTLSYITCPLLITAICTLIFLFLCRYLPSVASLLSGGRIK